jgi:hypothetical protein
LLLDGLSAIADTVESRKGCLVAREENDTTREFRMKVDPREV